MTTVVDFTQLRTTLIRTVAELDLNSEITEAEADTRLAGLVSLDLPPEARAEAYEELQEAIARLSYPGSDDYDPSQVEPEVRDLLTLQANAEHDIETALLRLTGGRS